jgi:hypothetical protein
MIPKFLYLEELIALRQVMKLTQFAKGIAVSECPIGVFSFENYQNVCETITCNSVLHFNDTDFTSRRKFQTPGSKRCKLTIKCMAMLNEIKIKPQIVRRYRTSSKASVHVNAKSVSWLIESVKLATYTHLAQMVNPNTHLHFGYPLQKNYKNVIGKNLCWLFKIIKFCFLSCFFFITSFYASF